MSITAMANEYPLDLMDFSIGEDITPLAANDTSGGIGSFQFSIAIPDPDAHHPVGSTAEKLIQYGEAFLFDRSVAITHSELGTFRGKIVNGSRSESAITYQGVGRASILNAYNVRAQPYSGTLSGLFRYYLSLVGIIAPLVQVDSALASRPVAAPGWIGELWYYLKALAVAHDAEVVAQGDGTFRLRQIRTRYASKGRNISRSQDMPIPSLAQSVEVYQYNNRPITEELVYPIGGWTEETEVLNVNAGEWAEYTLALSASVTSIQDPIMLQSVTPTYAGSSVFTVVANDGLPVVPEMWDANGGRVLITINPDTKSLRVRLRGATNIPMADGSGAATNFSLALGSDATGNRYSTLRIVGTGVAFDRQVVRIRTGVTATQTGTEVGVTIDNPFLSDKDQVYRAGTRAAVAYSGPVPSLSSEVTNIAGIDTQTFGNIAGTRIYDPVTKRYYRIRSATVTPAGIGVTADDDLTHSDVEGKETGLTYAQVQARRGGLSYQRDHLVGLV